MDEQHTIRLAVETLLEIVESASNIEICVVTANKIATMDQDALETLVAAIKKEKEEAEEAKKKK